MSFQDADKNSVKSLLALLRTSQGTASAGTSQRHAIHYPTSTPHPPVPTPAPSAIPSQRQLDDLISSLNGAGSASPGGPGSAFGGPRHNLIEPFGPVGQAGPSRMLYDANVRTASHPPSEQAGLSAQLRAESQDEQGRDVGRSRKGKERMSRDDPEYGIMSFKEALPILSELLEDEAFLRELMRMKIDQDSLERRLWAKQEKVKAEHERGIQAEREIAKTARRPIPPERQAEWAAKLATSLQDFYTQTCLPSIDGLAARQRKRLEQFGVPGLGGDEADTKTREKVRRIMGVLDAGLE